MRCREAERCISIRIDGEAVPRGVLDELEMHIAGCAACSRLLRDEEERARTLGAYLAGGNTQPLASAVMAAVRAGEARSARLPERPARGAAPYRGPLAVAAAAFLVVGALVFLRPGFHLAHLPGRAAVEGPGTRLIYVHERMAPSSDDSPFEKQVIESHRIILEPIHGGSGGPVPAKRGERQYMQYQKFTDYRYY